MIGCLPLSAVQERENNHRFKMVTLGARSSVVAREKCFTIHNFADNPT
jgi:hypothetical protein